MIVRFGPSSLIADVVVRLSRTSKPKSGSEGGRGSQQSELRPMAMAGVEGTHRGPDGIQPGGNSQACTVGSLLAMAKSMNHSALHFSADAVCARCCLKHPVKIFVSNGRFTGRGLAAHVGDRKFLSGTCIFFAAPWPCRDVSRTQVEDLAFLYSVLWPCLYPGALFQVFV